MITSRKVMHSLHLPRFPKFWVVFFFVVGGGRNLSLPGILPRFPKFWVVFFFCWGREESQSTGYSVPSPSRTTMQLSYEALCPVFCYATVVHQTKNANTRYDQMADYYFMTRSPFDLISWKNRLPGSFKG